MGLNRMMMKNGGVNPVMTLTAVFRGGHEQIGFLLFGGTPQPNGIYINGKKYNIVNIITQWFLRDYTATSSLSFEGNALPCNSVQLDINGTAHTFTSDGKSFRNSDGIFEENETYTIKVVSIT